MFQLLSLSGQVEMESSMRFVNDLREARDKRGPPCLRVPFPDSEIVSGPLGVSYAHSSMKPKPGVRRFA